MAADDPRSPIDSHLHFPWRERSSTPGRRICAWPDCALEGVHRAPRSRSHLREFVWFCLDHVREYNRSWDYFAGMSTAEIDAYRRADTTWHRPTWRFGAGWPQNPADFADQFGLFGDEPRPTQPRPDGRTAEMMALLELAVGFTLEELRRNYKAMVKRWHPDLHPGDKSAEERLRVVIEAYRFLRDNKLYAA